MSSSRRGGRARKRPRAGAARRRRLPGGSRRGVAVARQGCNWTDLVNPNPQQVEGPEMQLTNAATNRRGALAAARAASRPPPPPGARGCPMGFGRAAGEKNERAVAPVRASPARSSLGEKAKLLLSSLKNLVPNGNAGAAEVPLPEDPEQPPSLFDRLDAWAEAELGLDGAAALQATVDLF